MVAEERGMVEESEGMERDGMQADGALSDSTGGDGDDILKSGAGDDKVYGEGGNDTIIHNGSGTQYYDGGAGNDTYILDLENFIRVDFLLSLVVRLVCY